MKKSPGPPAAQIFTILLVLATLVMILVMRQRCADGVAGMFKAMDVAHDGGAAHAPAPDGGAH